VDGAAVDGGAADLEVEAEEDSADSVVVVVSAAAAPADLGDPWRA